MHMQFQPSCRAQPIPSLDISRYIRSSIDGRKCVQGLRATGKSDGERAPEVEEGWLWSQSRKGTIRNQLREKNFRPKKSMGQNFMEDENVLKDIVEYAQLDHSCVVVEVGPGTGAMTQHILKSGAKVYAIEKDDRLFSHYWSGRVESEEYVEDTWETESTVSDSLTVRHDDILKVDLSDIARHVRDTYQLPGDTKLLLMANLPYNITRDFLNKVMTLGSDYTSLVLMLQHEVAERLVHNSPGNSDWRAINVILQYYCDMKYICRIDRFKYTPVPKVDGAVVEVLLKPPSERMAVPSEKDFVALVKKGFLQRRKMLSNSLRPILQPDEIQQCLVSCGLPAESRAQNLSLEDFVALSWAVYNMKKNAPL